MSLSAFLDVIISNSNRFYLTFKFLKNPFIFYQNNIQNLFVLFNTRKAHLESDITLINEEIYLPNETMSDILSWKLMSDFLGDFFSFLIPSVWKSILPKLENSTFGHMLTRAPFQVLHDEKIIFIAFYLKKIESERTTVSFVLCVI